MGWYAHCLFGLGFGFDQEIIFKCHFGVHILAFLTKVAA